VLPIGGLKEKVLGAKRAGISKILFPRRNEVDLDDVPKEVRESMSFVPVDELSEVLHHALGKRLISPVPLGIEPAKANNVVALRPPTPLRMTKVQAKRSNGSVKRASERKRRIKR
jgi:predicted ATP-dependent protease